MRTVVGVGVCFVVACGRVGFDPGERMDTDAALSDAAATDAAVTADAPPPCTGPFQPAIRVAATSSSLLEGGGAISDDRLELYFERSNSTDVDILVSTRGSVAEEFGPPSVALGSTLDETNPFLEPDGLTMWYQRGDSIATAVRASRAAPWEDRGVYPGLASGSVDQAPALTSDGLTIYFSSDRPPVVGMVDLWRADRPDLASDFGPAVQETAASSPSFDCCPFVSPDGNAVWFTSQRNGLSEIWSATRRAGGTLDTPSPLPDFDSAGTAIEFDIFASRDGATVGLSSNRAGSQGADLWLYERSCL